jgi:hypothetical protein
MQLFCFQQNSLAQDTVSVEKPSPHKFKADPLKATMLAVSFPGLGQVYNRKYWKIPLVYAGFGGLIYSIGYNSSLYNEYMVAYQDFTDGIPQTKSYLNIIPGAVDTPGSDPVEQYDEKEAAYWEDRMIQGIDYYRRYRDLSYIGIAGWYLLSILDANVDASLFNYDINNNLDVAVTPSYFQLPGGYTGAGINLSLKITF